MKKNNKLIGYRAMAGLSRKDIANKVGLKETTYAAKETGRGSFREEEMLKIFNVLKKELKKTVPELAITDVFFNY